MLENNHSAQTEHDRVQEAIQHLQFQMSLLRLTALPSQLRGPVAQELQPPSNAAEADLLLEELSYVAVKKADPSR